MAENQEVEIPESGKSGDMPFLEHIEELRWRIIKSIVAVAIVAVVAFVFSKDIFKFITMPLGGVKLHFTEITGSFSAYVKIAIYTGIIGALPIILYQVWKFVSPGLYLREKKVILPIIFVSTILFLMGGAFCFFVVLPFAIKFLVNYGEGEMIPIVTVSSYISFAGLMILAFGLSFQLPIVGYFLAKIGVITARTLAKGRSIAIVLIVIFAGVITPTPDVFNQLLLAVPMYILYEITIVVVRMTARKKETET